MQQSDALTINIVQMPPAIQEEDGCNVSPPPTPKIILEAVLQNVRRYGTAVGQCVLHIDLKCLVWMGRMGIQPVWMDSRNDLGKIYVPSFKAINIAKVCSLATHLFLDNADTSTDGCYRKTDAEETADEKTADQIQPYLVDPLDAPKGFSVSFG